MLIAQITDLHINAAEVPAYGAFDTAACLRSLVGHLNRHQPRIDCVLVTGDNVDYGDPAEYTALRPLIDALEMPFFLIPGNHDHRDRLAEAFHDHGYLRGDNGFCCYAVDEYPLRLIGLDTSEPGESAGVLCETRLRWLDDCLAQAPRKPTLVFMHHPPFTTGIDHMDAIGLRDPDRFFAVLARHQQVRQVACGHVHRAVETVVHGIGISIAPNAAHAVSLTLEAGAACSFTQEPPAVRLFRFGDDGQLVSHLSYIGGFEHLRPIFGADGERGTERISR